MLDTATANSEKGVFQNKRPLLPHEVYSTAVFLTAAEVVLVCTQLSQTIGYLGSFRSTPVLKRLGVGRVDYLIYNLENYLLRATSVADRLLILVNDVYVLGYTPATCKSHILLRNKHLVGEPCVDAFGRLDQVLRKLRPERNVIAHQSRYRPQDLTWVEGLEILLREEPNPRYRWMLKRMTDQAVTDYKARFGETNTKIGRAVAAVLDALRDPFQHRWKSRQAAA